MPTQPLSGIRVLDLTNVLAGPYCSYQLMLYGAEVLKVEVPDSGDLARHLGPDAELNRAGLGASFLAQNAGKKSIELDLKAAGEQVIFEELVRGADVLVENFRAGVMARLGFGWERLRELNPSLVYCAITGFGQTGPMSQATGLRPDHPGPFRDDEHHRNPGDRTPAGRLPGLRHHRRSNGGAGDLRGADRP